MFTILHDLDIDASQQEVYDAVSQPIHLNNWWTLECEGVPSIDSEYRLYFDPAYDWRAKVISANAASSFALQMTVSSEDWEPTSFGFQFKPLSSNTRLSFFHKDWEVQSHHFRRTSYCWAILLKGLKQYIEKGIIIPFSERA